MRQLSESEKENFLNEHLRHRLTLLRTLRERKNLLKDYTDKGDIYRCIKDSNLIAVRLLLDFLGLRGELKEQNYSLVAKKSSHIDDVRIDQFVENLVRPSDIPVASARILAGVYHRADKELAHLTLTFNDEFNSEAVLIEAATIVEGLLEKYLYLPLGRELPEIDK